MQRPITSDQLRACYLAFFVEHGHAVLPSASLVPANDPTVLFTTAGMHPLVPNLLGAPHPAGTRLASVQKCVRTGDIDVIGDATHLTPFEMLGNWSLGDYFRDDAISWSFAFLTGERWLGLPLDRLGVTCFAGDAIVPRDLASAQRWTALGIARDRIQWLGRDDNWWGPAGKTGPCGPDTEIFYWIDPGPPPAVLDVSDRRWVEIWNNVFMAYTKTATGAIEPLARANVDTGMGLERTLVALNGYRSVYEVDTVAPVLAALRGCAPVSAGHDHELRVMTDHLRAASLLISDGVGPSNKDRGYVVRRLVRRCVVFAHRLAMPADWVRRGVAGVVAALGRGYPELAAQQAAIEHALTDEVAKFERTLARGLKLLGKLAVLDGQAAFDLFQTHGFPFELTVEIAEAAGKPVDREGFAAQLADHRARSRTTSAGAFEGGLADHSAEIVRYHTLTHLLQAALRRVLGDQVIQRGSNLTRDRLRFDFSYAGRPTPAELHEVEAMVNAWLTRRLIVDRATMPLSEARTLGAIGAFGETYGEIVSVYQITDPATGEVISCELCGGPHVQSIPDDIPGQLRIQREHSVSAGVRRIRAVLEPEATASSQSVVASTPSTDDDNQSVVVVGRP
jgi:alanyl-tRNA synthetase